MALNKFRADHVGSLLRPPVLLDARAAYAEGRVDHASLQHIEDQAVLAAIEMQRAAGIDLFTDGEYRRSTFRSGFAEAV
jgi:5-methyltetrahydropteroyltriglutamate--homocysteine methyltransferase